MGTLLLLLALVLALVLASVFALVLAFVFALVLASVPALELALAGAMATRAAFCTPTAIITFTRAQGNPATTAHRAIHLGLNATPVRCTKSTCLHGSTTRLTGDCGAPSSQRVPLRRRRRRC